MSGALFMTFYDYSTYFKEICSVGGDGDDDDGSGVFWCYFHVILCVLNIYRHCIMMMSIWR